MVLCLASQEVDTAIWVQIQDETGSFLYSVNIFGKTMNLIILTPAGL